MKEEQAAVHTKRAITTHGGNISVIHASNADMSGVIYQSLACDFDEFSNEASKHKDSDKGQLWTTLL